MEFAEFEVFYIKSMRTQMKREPIGIETVSQSKLSPRKSRLSFANADGGLQVVGSTLLESTMI